MQSAGNNLGSQGAYLLATIVGRDAKSVVVRIPPRSTVNGVGMAVLFFAGLVIGLSVDLAA